MKRSTWIGALAGFYLGFATSLFFGTDFTDWRWWVTVIPTIALFQWLSNTKANENKND